MNIKISLVLIFLLNFSSIKAGKIKILVSNIDQNKGIIHYGIYDNAEFFPNEKGKLLGGFKNVSDDQNSNNEFDTLFAIPTEKYGFSNNAKVFFGPPKFDDASIFVGENETIEIDIELR